MTASRIRRALHRTTFPLAACMSAVMYLVIAAGVPLPMAATVEKDLSQPFPCMNSPCGCQNAEQCWTSCCCHTPAERLAWAISHGVTPPACLIAAAKNASESKSAAASCCSKKTACCSTKNSCCAKSSHSCDYSTADCNDADHDHDEHNHARPTANRTVILIHALGCQGHGTDWLAGFVALAPKVVNWEYRPQPTATVAVFNCDSSSSASPPPVPPPRFSAA
jgi:hypothetical protein